jgi:hypoxanthine phosphoribosyltransferase
VELEPKFSETQIRDAVRRLGLELSESYRHTCPVLVGVLKGSFVFLADLVRELTIPFEVDFVRASSYGAGTRSSGKVEIIKDVETELKDRHVVVVEDIADTGLTLDAVLALIGSRQPASVKCCALLVREGCRQPEFRGLSIGEGFVVGYGIDYAERYRGLREIYALPGSSSSRS